MAYEVKTDGINYPNLFGYIEVPHSICRNCKFRKEHYKKSIPQDCYECGFLEQRDKPYKVRIPVWEDGYVPTQADRDYFEKHFRVVDGKITARQFKDKVRNAINVDEDCLSFSTMSNMHYADYRPKYPDTSAADLTISLNWITGEGEIRGNLQALIPTTKKYKDFTSMLKDLSEMGKEKSNDRYNC